MRGVEGRRSLESSVACSLVSFAERRELLPEASYETSEGAGEGVRRRLRSRDLCDLLSLREYSSSSEGTMDEVRLRFLRLFS